MHVSSVEPSHFRRRRTWTPCAELRPYVTSFELRDDRLGTTRILRPLPARSDCFLQFHLKEPYWVVAAATGATHRSPSSVLVGPHTRRTEDLLWTGELKVFTIRFSPVGFRSIFGVPAEAIRDTATCSELVLGSAVLALEALLSQAEDLNMPSLAETFLLKHLARQRVDARVNLVRNMTAAIQSPGRTLTLADVASEHDMSPRKMERLFQEFVGISPKLFERLHRTKRAVALKRAYPCWHWSSVAAAVGYFDQAHLIREFRSQNGSTPGAFLRSSQLAHEFRSPSSNLS